MVISVNDVASYCKRRGFIYPNSELYGGLAGFYDYGPMGVELKENIKKEWWNLTVHQSENVVGMDGTIITHPKVWEASGHVSNFVDKLTECKKCKVKHRADHLVEDLLKIPADGLSCEELTNLILKNNLKCPECKKGELSEVTKFVPMFTTFVGPSREKEAYLRPETAQLIFTQFKNIVETSRMTLPFGIAQIGKAFRNEISPRNFIFRLREFEQMELEFFAHPKHKNDCPDFDKVKDIPVKLLTAEAQESKGKEITTTFEALYKDKIVKSKWHAFWLGKYYSWMTSLGVNKENLRLREHRKDELSHYSSATLDIEYKYDFGYKELSGFADRSDYDLSQHMKASKKDLSLYDEETKEKVIPHVVVEPSFGLDRLFLTFLIDAYHEEEVKDEKRVILKLHPKLAPFKVAIFPLIKKDMSKKAHEIYLELRTLFNAFYDESGSIGRRYRRQDEIGTPFCITIDSQTAEDNTVTLRYRDSLLQERVQVSELITKLNKLINS